MIIIIPIGGVGKRFKEKGYNKPKALINIYGKPIISYLLDNLNTNNIEYIFIPYNKEYMNYRFEDFLIKTYPNIIFKFFCLENNTRGAAETINIGINNLDEKRDIPVLCLDSDNFYTHDIISQWNGENCIFSFKDFNENTIFSYVKTNENDQIIDIKEKVKISNNACTGAYGFSSINELKKYTSKIIEENITQKSEFYTSGVIKTMINDGKSFMNINISNKYYFSLGTPEQVDQYKHPFLFDLDGTLVDTDNIYIKVWNFIMKKYNLSVDDSFFKFFIQGNNDISFLKKIFANIKSNEIFNNFINRISAYYHYHAHQLSKQTCFEFEKTSDKRVNNSRISPKIILIICNKSDDPKCRFYFWNDRNKQEINTYESSTIECYKIIFAKFNILIKFPLAVVL